MIPINEELQSQFGFYPSIFKSENKNMLVILGGDLQDQERLTISIVLEDSKVAEQELKIKKHKTGLRHRGQIHNSTIQVDEDEGNSTFMSSMGILESITLSHIKLHN